MLISEVTHDFLATVLRATEELQTPMRAETFEMSREEEIYACAALTALSFAFY